MTNPQHHTAKRLRLTEAGYQRLYSQFPSELKGSQLYEHIAGMSKGEVSKNTVDKILKREQPVQYYGLAVIFMVFELTIEDADFEPFPAVTRGVCRHYHVPQELSEWFTGRIKELETLRALLKKNSVVVIPGLGGMGKTQTALAYCERHQAEYEAVFWIRAESEAGVQQGYAEIARQLKLQGTALSEQEKAEAALQWLEKHSGWLLVLDNLDAPQPGKLYWPRSPKAQQGHVLITTRAGEPALLVHKVPLLLKTLLPQESLEFLLRRCRRGGASAVEREAAGELAEKMSYLPLAMEQAAAYIVSMTTTFANYLTLYKKRELAQLAKSTPAAGDYPGTVQTTWEINFQAIEEEAQRPGTAGRYAPHLLNFCAFLAPDDIPLELVQHGSEAYCPALHDLFKKAEDEAEAEEIYNEVLEPLTRYSLVARNLEARTFGLHRLVQAVTRDRLEDKKREWQERAVRAVADAFPIPEVEQWSLCERLLPHAIAASEIIRGEKITTEAAGNLLNNAGRYLVECGRFVLAESYCLLALKIRQEIYKDNHPQIAVSLNNMGLMCHYQGRCEEAEAYYKQALEMRRKILPDNHLDIAECLNDLAGLYDQQGRCEEAETLFAQALTMVEEGLPYTNEHAATIFNNLGLMCYRQKRHDEAERQFARALALWSERRFSSHPLHATCLHNLAQLYRRQNRVEEARPLLQEALSMQNRAYSAGHPDIAITHHNLAQVYEALGCRDKAEEHYKEALETSRKAFGEDHSETIADRQTLEAFYKRRLS